MGHVVMSGSEPESLAEFNISESPIINILPSVNDIVEKMLYILDNKSKITEWGYKSRQYVEGLHDHISVAENYVRSWEMA